MFWLFFSSWVVEGSFCSMVSWFFILSTRFIIWSKMLLIFFMGLTMGWVFFFRGMNIFCEVWRKFSFFERIFLSSVMWMCFRMFWSRWCRVLKFIISYCGMVMLISSENVSEKFILSGG